MCINIYIYIYIYICIKEWVLVIVQGGTQGRTWTNRLAVRLRESEGQGSVRTKTDWWTDRSRKEG